MKINVEVEVPDEYVDLLFIAIKREVDLHGGVVKEMTVKDEE